MNRLEIEVSFTDEQAMKALGLPSHMLEEMIPMIHASRAIANPKALYGEVDVETIDDNTVLVGGVRMVSRILQVNLQGRANAVPYVCTCGAELGALSSSTKDPMDRYFQDALNEMVLHLASTKLRELVAKEYALDPMYAMSPGSIKDWPLPAQGPLFAVLGDVKEQIGVELTKDFLMMPIKSVSGIYFTTEQEYVNCMLCEILSCPTRRAPYDPTLYQQRFASSMEQQSRTIA